jgi:hypothetical protein
VATTKGTGSAASTEGAGPSLQADEQHVSSASGSNVDINAGKAYQAVSDQRREEAQAEFGEDALSAAEQKERNSKIKLVTPDKGGVTFGATGAPIQEGGSGVHGGVI